MSDIYATNVGLTRVPDGMFHQRIDSTCSKKVRKSKSHDPELVDFCINKCPHETCATGMCKEYSMLRKEIRNEKTKQKDR